MSTRLPQLLALLLCASAFAQGKPTLIDSPLDVKVALPAAQQEELQTTFRQLLARNPAVLVPTRGQWKAAVAALKRQDCEVRDECLQQLATTAATLYALYASVEQNAAGTEVTATGRVVNQDRLQVRSRLTFTVPRKGSVEEAARDALRRLLAALELEKLPAVLTPPVEPKPAPQPLANAAPLQPRADDLVLIVPALPPEPRPEVRAEVGPSPLRVGAWLTGGLGVAALGVCAGFGVSAAVGRGALPADGRLLDDSQARAQVAVNRDASVALGTGLGAAALLGSAAILFLTSAPPSAPRLSLTPAPGGAQLVLTGELDP